MTITNLSPRPIEAWSLQFQGNFDIGNVWDARLTESQGQTYTIGSQAWTNPIQYNSSVSFGFMGLKSAGTEVKLTDYVLKEVVASDGFLRPVDDVIDQGDLEVMMTDGTVETLRGTNGVFRVIDGTFTDQAVTSADDAAAVLNSASSLFGARFNADAAEVTPQNVPSDGEAPAENIYRFTPDFGGIPTLGSEIVLTTDEQGTVTGMFNTYNRKIESVDTNATVTEQQAVDAALAKLLAEEEIAAALQDTADEGNLNYSYVQDEFISSLTAEPRLVVFALSDTEAPVLAWEVGLTTDPGYMPTDDLFLPPIGQDEYVYANGTSAGTLFQTIPYLLTWSPTTVTADDLLIQSRTFGAQEENGQYRLADETRNVETYDYNGLPGNLITFTDAPDKSAVSAHANASEVYEFYKNVLNRDSYDGQGSSSISTINYPVTNNAGWHLAGDQMLYGSGDFEAALDVVGHEFTHGVIDNISDQAILAYQKESGALNEAIADIMGALIEDKNGGDRWLIGEDSGIGAIRNMSNPMQFNYPDHYNNRYTGSQDYGGVHINSGIFSFAAYKMMTDSRTSSISEETWAKVFYRSLNRMTLNSTFLDGRGAVIAAAKSLGFDRIEQQTIKDSFDEVGICAPVSIRISLTWGEHPYDLDSHLIGPAITGSGNFHTYFSDLNYYQDGTYYSGSALLAADLDHDDVTSYGPEITTVHTLTSGDYYFYVHDYTNRYMSSSRALASSGARVHAYHGTSSIPFATFNVDTNTEGTSWGVFKLTISGDSLTCVALDDYGYESTPSRVGP